MKRGREEEEKFYDIERFHDACKNGDMSTVQEFFERGVDVNALDDLDVLCKQTTQFLEKSQSFSS